MIHQSGQRRAICSPLSELQALTSPTQEKPPISHVASDAPSYTLSVKELSEARAKSAIKSLLDDVANEWRPVESLPSGQTDEVDPGDWKFPKRTYREKWNDRIEKTLEMLRYMVDEDMTDWTIMASYLGEKPIGILAMSRDSPPVVENLVTHPGSRGVGAHLLERAVRTSDAWGEKGKLTLVALGGITGDAWRAYERFGFEQWHGSFMLFDPALKSQWTRHDGKWKMKKDCCSSKAEKALA